MCKIATHHLYYQVLYPEAELAYQRSLALLEQIPTTNHQDIIEPLLGLAQTYWYQHKYPAATLYTQRAIGILERTQGDHQLALIEALNMLGQLHGDQGEFAEAEELLLRALSIWVAIILHDCPDPDHVSPSRTDLASPPFAFSNASTNTINRSEQRRYNGQELSVSALIPQVFSLWKQAPLRHHWQVGHALAILCRVYQQQQRYQEAEAILLPLLHLGTQALGEKHPMITYPLETLAATYKGQNRLAEAEQCYQRILAILESALGAAHSRTIETRTTHTQLLAEIAKAQCQQNDKSQATYIAEQSDKRHMQNHMGNNAALPGETSSVLSACPHCHSNAAVIKSGSNRSHSPRFRCRTCQRYFTPQPRPQGHDLSLKQQALALVAQGKSYRSIARTLHVDHRTIGIWAKEEKC